jgi:hypothetical protein
VAYGGAWPRAVAALEEWGQRVTRSDLCFKVLPAIIDFGFFCSFVCLESGSH